MSNPRRSDSRSKSRENASCDEIAPACVAEMAAPATCEFERAASSATPIATNDAMDSFFDWKIWRAMCRCVTWEISCASTPASSDSVCAASNSPVWTPMKPPGSAKALMLGSSMAKNSKPIPGSLLTATSRAPNWLI